MIADVQHFLGANPGPINRRREDARVRFGHTRFGRTNGTMKVVIDTNTDKARVAIGDGDDGEAFGQGFERRLDIRKQFDAIARCIEHVVSSVDHVGLVLRRGRHMRKHTFPQKAEVVRHVSVFQRNLFA